MTNYNILTELTNIQLAFVIIAPIVVLLFVGICLAVVIVGAYRRKYFQIHFYKQVYRVALDNDYYLINQFVYKVDSSKNATLDHILFGNKFIYVIISKYYQGDLVGKYNDPSLIFISHKGKKCYTENPYNEIKYLASKLSTNTGLDTTLMIGIVLINDDCKVEVESESKQFYVIQRKRLPALIKAIESRPIDKINDDQLQKAVQAIAKSNKRKK